MRLLAHGPLGDTGECGEGLKSRTLAGGSLPRTKEVREAVPVSRVGQLIPGPGREILPLDTEGRIAGWVGDIRCFEIRMAGTPPADVQLHTRPTALNCALVGRGPGGEL